MEIRRLTDLDAESYRQLRHEALEREPQAFTESVAEHQAMRLENDQEIAWSPRTTTLFLGPSSIANSSAWPDSFRRRGEKIRHRGGIWGVYVSEECRGKGVGRDLLAELIGLVRLLPGIEQVALAVSRQNAGAKGLYESLGFEVYGCEKARPENRR